MSLSTTEIKQAADLAIGSAAVDGPVRWKALLTVAVETPPLQETTSPQYDPVGISVVAWVKLKPQGPVLPISDEDLWRMGENTNVDALFYVSALENERKALGLHLDNVKAQILYDGRDYDVQAITPRSHVHGEPAYFRIAAVRGAATR